MKMSVFYENEFSTLLFDHLQALVSLARFHVQLVNPNCGIGNRNAF
jgi:hypothetical protein